MTTFWTKAGALTVTIGALVLLQACSPSAPPQTKNETAPPPAAEETALEANTAADAGFVEVRDKKFKLAPDIPKDGSETHMDFYARDAQDKHVPEAQIVLHLTTPGGEKQTFDLTDDEGGEHYHAKVKLTEPGEYQATAQVTVNGEKYNPRFSFNYP